jgi:hypothetical protein
MLDSWSLAMRSLKNNKFHVINNNQNDCVQACTALIVSAVSSGTPEHRGRLLPVPIRGHNRMSCE